MILDFSTPNLSLIFEITNDNIPALRHISCNGVGREREKKLPYCNIADLQVSGGNTFDLHFAKHTGTSGGRHLRYVSHKSEPCALGTKLEFLLTDGQLEVTVHYQLYTNIAAVRAWCAVKNVSEKPIGLEYLSSFCYAGFDDGERTPNEKLRVYIPHNAWMREMNWKEYTLSELGYERGWNVSGKRVAVSNTGTWSSKEHLPMGAVRNTETENTMLWQIESNGSWHWELGDLSNMMYLKISGPTEQENQWYKELKPGECFEGVKACVALGSTFDAALAEMTKYRRTIAKRGGQDAVLPVIFNDFNNCLRSNPTEETSLPLIDKAAEAGAEYYVMDAGWYADGTWWDTVGEWQPVASRFPHGIKYVFDYVRQKGMIPGIWLEPESMGIRCPLADQWEDACFFMRHGKRVADRGRYFLDFRHPHVRAYMTGVIDRVVTEYGVGYIKFDYNVDGGSGTEIHSDSYGDGLLQHTRALLDWFDSISQKYPDLIMESCSSGGMRMDYAMLSQLHLQSLSDQEHYRENAYVAAAASAAVLPEQAAVWAYPLKTEDADAVSMNMANALLQRIHLSGETAWLSDEMFALVKEAIAVYKSVRSDIPKAIPFYPIGIPQYGAPWLCSAYRYPSCIRMTVWRMDGDTDTLKIPLEQPIGKVKLLYPFTSNCKLAAKNDSVAVTLPRKYSAIVLEIN